MHTLVACLSVIISLLAVAWSVRRVRAVERRLGDVEDRLSLRLAKVERGRRVPADVLERLLWKPAPIPREAWKDDEEQFNPLMR